MILLTFRNYRLLLILVFMYSSCIYGYSQVKPPKFGIKSGISVPLLHGENYYTRLLDEKFRINTSEAMVSAGVFLELPIGNHFAVQPEIFYNKNGYDWYSSSPNRGSQNVSDPDMTEIMEFVSIPLLMKLKFGGFAIFAAPQLDMLISAKRKVIAELQPERDAKKEYESTSWSMCAGLEYTLHFGLGFALKHQAGLTNIAVPVDNLLYEKGDEVKNNLATLNVFFVFGKKRDARR